MTSHYCNGLLVDVATRSHMGGDPSWQFRGRLSQPSPGAMTSFSSSYRSLEFNTPFWQQCGNWVGYLNHLFYYYSPYAVGTLYIDWIGEVGTKACHRSTWGHNRARAMDLCQIRFTNGYSMDCNHGHAASLIYKRRYLATAASLRVHFGNVLTGWYNAAHRDHIHFDDQVAVGRINSSKRSDTTLIQAACNHLNGAGIAIDGSWGPATTTAYNNLLSSLNMQCYDPRSSTNHAKLLLYYITLHGTANRSAGHWTAGC